MRPTKQTLVMGVLNVTPDSFSDGGVYYRNPKKAVARIQDLLRDGADIIDIGGESSRPGSEAVSEAEELQRVIPVIELARKNLGSKFTISIDSNKAQVAREALQKGVDIVNSVGGFMFDKNMPEVIKEFGCEVIICHTKSRPKDIPTEKEVYKDIAQDILKFFEEQITEGKKTGLKKDQFIIDPGIGFGKTMEQNLEIIQRLDEFKKLKLPILVGISRKSHLGEILKDKLNLKSDPGLKERLEAGLAETAVAVLKGADIVRTHDSLQTKKFLVVLNHFTL